jgi:hypothetical protein
MMKGAFIELIPAINIVVPNVIVFQFNPETLRHSWSQASAAPTQPGRVGSSPVAVSGLPSETFSFSLSLDVTDTDPGRQVIEDAESFGIYTRLSALEKLLYPTIVSDIVKGITRVASGKNRRQTPAAQLPTVLFVWGMRRILPVVVTSLMVTENLYDANLNPTHAEAQVELRVLTPNELEQSKGLASQSASVAYLHTLGFRLERAVAAAANAGSGRGLIGLLQNAKDPMGRNVLPR